MKHHKPVTPSMRSYISSDRTTLWKEGPVKFLSKRKISSGGRNNLGRITCRHRGGGHKKDVRIVDFKRVEADAVVDRIEYDPNRSSLIALIRNPEGALSYIIAPEGIKVGDRVRSGTDAPIANGNCLPLYKIPVGTVLHNIELKPGKGGQLARSAGAYGQLVSKGSGYAQIKLRSSEVRLINLDCKATIGTVSNAAHRNVSLGKAGRARWMGRRPTVRGVAMNPVDHPHGGGEGKSSGGRHPCTPWGKGTKGKKSPRKKSAYKYIVKRRSK